MDLSRKFLLHLYLLVMFPAEADKKDLQLSKPKIIRKYKPCTPRKPSDLKCAMQCSVTNAPGATLTIYNDSSVFSINKVADPNIDLSLCMEVEHQDTNNYTCVVNNIYSSQTAHFNINYLCQACPEKGQTPMAVTGGESVTLHTGVTVQKLDHIRWMFEYDSQSCLIAETSNNNIFLYDCDDGIFKNRLLLDSQTGDLTITNTSKRDSGVFTLEINNGVSRCYTWSFKVTIFAPLPFPIITTNHSQISSSHNCPVLCSVVNVSAVSLSWYKGNSSLSSINVSDFSISLSLPLEVEYQDNNTYSCVVNNTIRNQTTHLDTSKLCPVPTNWRIPVGVGVGVGVAVVAVAVCIHRRRKTREGSRRLSQSASPQPDYQSVSGRPHHSD